MKFIQKFMHRRPLSFGLLIGVPLAAGFGLVLWALHVVSVWVSQTPWLFPAMLRQEPDYTHRWVPHTLEYYAALALAVIIGLTLVKLWWARSKAEEFAFNILLAAVLLTGAVLWFVGFQHGGIALYKTHFAVSAPATFLRPSVYSVDDVVRIETGCQIRCFSFLTRRCPNQGATAIYDVHTRDGRVFRIGQAVATDFADPTFVAALDHFDQSARRAGIARTYRKNLLDEPEAEQICYERMADHASGETLKALHRLSQLN